MKGKGEKSLSVPRLLPEDELVAKIAIMALLDIQRQRDIEESSFSFFSGLVEPLMKKNFPAWQLFTQLAHGTYLECVRRGKIDDYELRRISRLYAAVTH